MTDDTISRAAAVALVEDVESKRLRGEIDLTYAPMIKGIKAQPSATDTNVATTDTISRQAAVDAAVKMFEAWYGGSVLRDREIRARFEALPSAQPDVSDTNVGKMCEYYDLCRNGRDEKKLREELLSAQPECEDCIKHGGNICPPCPKVPECEDAVSRAAVINAWRDACNSVMSKCACHYDDDIKDTVYDNTSEVNAVLRCNKEFKNALKVLPLITPKQPGWIPCSERLPERYDNYIITTEDGMVVFGVYDPREEQWCRYDSIKSWWLYGIKVLAWQPKPKPWEGDANG